MAEIENWQANEEYWSSREKEPDIPKGCFTQLKDTFVLEEHLLEYALEKTQEDSYYRDSFLEKVLDYIESDKEAKEKFLKWFYPDYGEEK